LAERRAGRLSSRRAATPPRGEAVERLYDALEAYERLYQFRDPNNACLFDLRVNECYVLELVAESGSLSVVDVAAALGIHKSNASRIAGALRDKGFLTVKAAADDGRSILLQASTKGRRHYRALRSYLVKRFSNTLRDLSADDIATVAKAVALLAEDAEKRMRQRRGVSNAERTSKAIGFAGTARRQ
jgi:DNA-binding MarR family transcriptional regulator